MAGIFVCASIRDIHIPVVLKKPLQFRTVFYLSSDRVPGLPEPKVRYPVPVEVTLWVDRFIRRTAAV